MTTTKAVPSAMLLATVRPQVDIKPVENGWQQVTLRWQVDTTTHQNELSIPLELGFFVTLYHDRGEIRNPWAHTAEFLWQRWAKPLHDQGQLISAPLESYVRHTYDWAFKGWADSVWQEFDLEADERLLEYTRACGDRLIALQDSDGFFPDWLHPETHEPGPVMNQTPETSLSVTFQATAYSQ